MHPQLCASRGKAHGQWDLEGDCGDSRRELIDVPIYSGLLPLKVELHILKVLSEMKLVCHCYSQEVGGRTGPILRVLSHSVCVVDRDTCVFSCGKERSQNMSE
jgi:hypothetical protein